MASAALWATLILGLQLWAVGHAAPSQVMITPYVPEPGSSCRPREYYDKRAQMCCSMCPPGYHARFFCSDSSDTVCSPCEDSTYTQLWNWVPECLSCGSRCSSDQVETQACTREQNRVCTCGPGSYCMLKSQQGCRLCAALRKCPPGFGVSKPGTATSDVVCAACAPGTFSDTASSTDTCRPHQRCKSVAIPGSATTDAVCTSMLPTKKTMMPILDLVPQPESTKSQHEEPTLGPSTAPSTSDLLPVAPSPPAKEVITSSISLPIGLIVGLTALGLLIIVLVNCVILTQKKKKPFCLQGEAKVPHLPADKAQEAPGSEQQHLLTTAPSSSSSSLESSASTADRGARSRNQPQAPGTDKASGSREARASSGSAESSPGSHGTQVNVTCIVNVCSGSDHGSQCSSQASFTTENTDSNPSGSTKDEQVPFSKEECPFRSHPGAPETLLQSSEEKPLDLGMPDAGDEAQLTRLAWAAVPPRWADLPAFLAPPPALWFFPGQIPLVASTALASLLPAGRGKRQGAVEDLSSRKASYTRWAASAASASLSCSNSGFVNLASEALIFIPGLYLIWLPKGPQHSAF